MGFALAARPFFWIRDHVVAARQPALWGAWRTLRRDAASLRWNAYGDVLAAKAAGLSPDAMTWGETPLCVALPALRRARVGAGSRVVDLGAGIGSVLLAARALGAEAHGVELSARRVAIGRRAMLLAGATLYEGDVRTEALDGATHIWLSWTCMPTALRERLEERLARLPAGTTVVATTWAPRGPYALQDQRAVATPWGRVDLTTSVRV